MMPRIQSGIVLALAVGALVSASAAAADEWYDAYGKGMQALGRKDAAGAIEHFERAIRKRPEPGNELFTYGTNRIARYHPYLMLAQAQLAVGDTAAARATLARSEQRGREPADGRSRLLAEAEALERARAALQVTPPATSVPAAPPTTIAASAPTTTVAAAPPPPVGIETNTAAPAMPASSATPGVTMAARRARSEDALARTEADAPLATTPQPAPRTLASLVVVTEPPGALVYVDDEPVGASDPDSGRLVKSGIEPGSHRVRAEHDGVSLQTTEVVVGPEGPTAVHLAPTSRPRISRWPLVSGGLALVIAAAGLLWLLGMRRHATGQPATPVASRGTSMVRPATPTVLAPTAARATSSRLGDFDESLVTAEMTTLPGTPRPSAPERFGDYLLLERLGRGGMAHVYRARRGDEELALKRPLVAFLEDSEFRERFLREAELGRTLHHPNIIRIFERGDVAGVPYFTMELVHGETLHARLQRLGAMPPRDAVEFGCQVAEALDYAHLKGIVHRDLKPSNIMVPETGPLKVMDYGIARARRFEGLTLTGAFLGTPEYVAPETAEGRGCDARSDLYSLGIVLYETLTGRRPFVGDSPYATIRKHCTEPPTPPSSIATVPKAVEAVVLRLLAKQPQERYASAEELLVELRQFLNRATA